MLTGHARPAEPSEDDAEKGYVAFELLIGEVLAVRYDELGDLQAERWRPSRPDSD